MDEDLKKQLEWLNQNLTAVVKNQAIIYSELKTIENRIPDPDKSRELE
ncbi:hypothetical protein [Caproicibacter fermentans]|uniref:Uncharacterized protein n=1 Tax=Caproicibacter fermentans TaxID=2576756 RepID=A0A7G8T9N4_9FIRM|nr:hypothetical protein [Caproicibacter fermentans]QNK40325.1 hypothetical protein HCR03_16890 [Caproicibacter fermentans]